MQYLGRQFTFEEVSFAHSCIRAQIHDALRFMLQPDCVGDILPHDRAEVTKTCSKRKPGFWYGFLMVAADCGSSLDEFFMSIMIVP